MPVFPPSVVIYFKTILDPLPIPPENFWMRRAEERTHFAPSWTQRQRKSISERRSESFSGSWILHLPISKIRLGIPTKCKTTTKNPVDVLRGQSFIGFCRRVTTTGLERNFTGSQTCEVHRLETVQIRMP